MRSRTDTVPKRVAKTSMVIATLALCLWPSVGSSSDTGASSPLRVEAHAVAVPEGFVFGATIHNTGEHAIRVDMQGASADIRYDDDSGSDLLHREAVHRRPHVPDAEPQGECWLFSGTVIEPHASVRLGLFSLAPTDYQGPASTEVVSISLHYRVCVAGLDGEARTRQLDGHTETTYAGR